MFFTTYHDALVATLSDLVSEDGEVIIAAPERGTTMAQFLDKAKLRFKVEVEPSPEFTKMVSSLGMEDLTPKMIRLTKPL